MAEWGAVLLGCGFVLFAVVAVILLHTLRRVLLRTEDVLGKAGNEISQLAAESRETIVQVTATLSELQSRVEEVRPFCESLQLAGVTLAATLERADTIVRQAADSAMERLERAHRENELRFAEAYRWLDAGLSVWHSFKRQSQTSTDDHA